RYLSLLSLLAADVPDTVGRALQERAAQLVNGADHPELRERLAAADLASGCAAGESHSTQDGAEPGSVYLRAWAELLCANRRGDAPFATHSANRLIEGRGQAYSEIHGDYLNWVANVAASNLALLALAESAPASTKDRTAALDRFLGNWTRDALPPHLRRRVEALESRNTAQDH
ncbi:MAG: hypothetical protein ACOVKS_07890, partial [Aquimonas sp.]